MAIRGASSSRPARKKRRARVRRKKSGGLARRGGADERDETALSYRCGRACRRSVPGVRGRRGGGGVPGSVKVSPGQGDSPKGRSRASRGRRASLGPKKAKPLEGQGNGGPALVAV
jgi:hypothetical protein